MTRDTNWLSGVAAMLMAVLEGGAAGLEYELISRAGRVSTTPGGDSLQSVLSGDGKWVAFQSDARNLLSGNENGRFSDVFIQAVASGRTERVSVSVDGFAGNGESELAGVSRDGRYVLFVSDASNLVPLDENETADVFLRDRETGVTRLVSVATSGKSAAGTSALPSMSPNGRFVVFESDADDLVEGDVNGLTDVFWRDMEAQTTRRISVPSSVPTVATRTPGNSTGARVSNDGATVVFRSAGSNLAPPIRAGTQTLTNDLYYWRAPVATNRMVDVFGENVTVRTTVGTASYDLSADGKYLVLALRSGNTNQVPVGVYWVDLDTGEYDRVTAGLRGSTLVDSEELLSPALTADGQTVFFELQAIPASGTLGAEPVVHAWSASAKTNRVISSGGWVTNLVGEASESRVAEYLGASPDGRFVAYLGGSTNDPPGIPDRQLIVADLSTGESRRVSRTSTGGPVRDTGYPLVTFSDDGRRMAFHSISSELTADDFNNAWDCFLYDWDADTLRLVSARASDKASATPYGTVFLSPSAMSGDGRWVTYVTTAPGLAADDEAGHRNVYRFDRQTGTRTLVSAGIGGRPGNSSSDAPAASRDGRFVAFTSNADNLVPGDTNRVEDVFLRDLETGVTTLVSRRADGGFPSSRSTSPAISPDGRWIAFVSASTDLSPLDAGGAWADVFVMDRLDEKVHLVSISASGTASGNSESGQPMFSPDSRWLVFETRSSNLVGAGTGTGRRVYARQLETGGLRRIALQDSLAGGRYPGPIPFAAFSPDGRYLAFRMPVSSAAFDEALLHDFETATTSLLPLGGVTAVALNREASRVVYRTTNAPVGGFQIRMFDRATGNDVSVSSTPGGIHGNAPSDPPLVSADGRRVIFASGASNLVENDNNEMTDIFVKDFETGLLVRYGGNSLSASPILSEDGKTLLFRSFSNDLVANDFNNSHDLFAVRLEGADPVFALTGWVRTSNGGLRLTWQTRAGKTYRVQTAFDPKGPWLDAGATVATGGGGLATSEVGVPTPESRAFFRIEER